MSAACAASSSFASILWAAVPGDAWEGANRTLLAAGLFALRIVRPHELRALRSTA
jgi:hypothetical protein